MGNSLDQWRRSLAGQGGGSKICKQRRRALKQTISRYVIEVRDGDTTSPASIPSNSRIADVEDVDNIPSISNPNEHLLLGSSPSQVATPTQPISYGRIADNNHKLCVVDGCYILLILYIIRTFIGTGKKSISTGRKSKRSVVSSGGSTSTSSNNVVSQTTSSSIIATTTSSVKVFVASLFTLWPVKDASALSDLGIVSSPKSVWSIVMIGVLVGVYFALMSGSGERRSSRRTSASGGGLQRDIENQMEDDTSTNKRKSTSPPAGSGASDGKPLRKLKDLLFSEKLEKKIDEIKKKHANSGGTKRTKTENNDIAVDLERVILKYTPILMCCNNKSEVYNHYYEFRASILAVLEKVPGYGRDMINMGEDLCDDTLALFILHYATDSEKENVTGRDNLSKMERDKSSCIDFAWYMLPGSLFREYFRSWFEKGEDPPSPLNPDEGEAPISDSTPSEPAAPEDTPAEDTPEDTSDTKVAADSTDVSGNGETSPTTSQHEEKARAYWNKVSKYITKRITLLDFRFVISKDKENFQKELKDLVNGDMDLFDIVGAMSVGFHNLYYHLRTNGKRLANIIMSTHVWNVAYSLCDSDYQAKAAQLCGYIPHPECFLAGYIRDVLVYDDDLVKYFDSVIEAGFAEIFRQVFEVDDHSSTVARRFNRGDLTDEEVAALNKLLLEIRIKGGTTCGNMRTFIKAIIDRLLSKDTDIDTEEEAFDLLPGILRRLRARYASDPTVGDAMMEDEGKEEEVEDEEEDTDDDDDTDYSVYVDACYKTYKALIEQCDKKSRQDINKLVAKLRSLYKGSAKSGLMKSLASKLFGIGGLDSDCATEQITTKLVELKSSMEVEGGAFDGTLVVFTKLLKYAPDYANELGTLAEKLRNMYLSSVLGGKTYSLMRSLANRIFSSLGENCEDDDVVTELKRLKSLHEDVSEEEDKSEAEQSSSSSSSNDESSNDEQSSSSGESGGSSSEEAFAALVGHAPQYADSNCYASLATKLRSMFMGRIRGSKTSGLMQTLASAMLDQFKADVLSDSDTIIDKLTSLHQQYKSSLNNDGRGSSGSGFVSRRSSSEFDVTVREAYLALVTHKPSISEDFSSLVSLISYYALNDEAAFQQNLDRLEEYIEDNFNKPNGRFADSNIKFVYSIKADGNCNSLSGWWSDIIGYTTHRELAPLYKKASCEQLTKLREILGDNFDNYPAIDAAIEAAKSQKHEKKDTAATKKKKSKSRLGGVFSS